MFAVLSSLFASIRAVVAGLTFKQEEEDFNSQDYEDEDRDLFVEEEEEVENSGRSRLKKRKRLDEYGEDYQEEDGEYDPNIGEEEVEGEGEENFEEDEAQTTAPKPKRRRKKKEEDPDAPPRELTEEEKIEKEFEDHVLGAVKREKATICKRKKIPTSEIDAHGTLLFTRESHLYSRRIQ